jgi:hypothetical protein
MATDAKNDGVGAPAELGRLKRARVALMTDCRLVSSKWAVAVLALTLVVDARAGQTVDQYLSFSEFGTLGAVHSDYGQADFIGNVVQLRGAGYSGSWSVTPDSDLGVQANLTLTDKLSGVIQVLSRDSADGNFKPSLEWVNLKYDFTADFSVRAGRILLPTFQLSDVQNVGYALPMVRIPLEFNYTDSAAHSDGVDLLYRIKTGPVVHLLQAQAGYADENIPGAEFTTVRAKIAMLSDSFVYGDTSAQLAYQHYERAEYPRLRQNLIGLGLTYDPGAYFLMADTNYTKNTFLGSTVAWYASAGARFGELTPYAFYASTHASAVGSSGLTALGDEHSVGAGLRWDFIRNFDAKLQFEQGTLVSVEDTAAFANIQPGARPGDKANVVSVALDFVF